MLNIAGSDFTLHEVGEAARIVQEAADPDANIIFGAVVDSTLKDEIQVTVIATGFEARPQQPQRGSRYSKRVRAPSAGRLSRAIAQPSNGPNGRAAVHAGQDQALVSGPRVRRR